MNFEQPPQEEQPQQQSAAEQIYEAQGLEGPSLDFSRMRYGSRQEALAKNPRAKELYDQVVEIIDTEQYALIGSRPEDVIGAIGLAASENNWKSYDDVKFDKIREELKKSEIPLRERSKPNVRLE